MSDIPCVSAIRFCVTFEMMWSDEDKPWTDAAIARVVSLTRAAILDEYPDADVHVYADGVQYQQLRDRVDFCRDHMDTHEEWSVLEYCEDAARHAINQTTPNW